jgi:hypothetical protein
VNSTETDRALDALNDNEFEQLLEASSHHWSSRLARVLIPLAVLAVNLALAYILWRAIHAFWPGSLAAAVAATIIYVSVLVGSIRAVLSLSFSQWLVRVLARKQIQRQRAAHRAP